MKKFCLMLALASFVVISRAADEFADSVVSYDPGTGYVAGYTNVSAVLGEPSTIDPYDDATSVFDRLTIPTNSSPSARRLAHGGIQATHPASTAQSVRH